MKKAGVPVVSGSMGPVRAEREAEAFAKQLGYPVIMKAVHGGGGKRMRIIKSAKGIRQAIELTKLEAEASFGNAGIYLEKPLEKPRHIEFQVLADKQGSAIHLCERECSIQRRHQKLIEESPSPIMTEEKRKVIGKKSN